MTKYIRVVFVIASCIAAGFAFSATGRHPYNFYTLTRWIVFITCCWGLWLGRRRIWPSVVPGYAVVGLLFNPFLAFHFTRSTWHTLDMAAGIFLLAALAFSHASLDRGQPSAPSRAGVPETAKPPTDPVTRILGATAAQSAIVTMRATMKSGKAEAHAISEAMLCLRRQCEVAGMAFDEVALRAWLQSQAREIAQLARAGNGGNGKHG